MKYLLMIKIKNRNIIEILCKCQNYNHLLYFLPIDPSRLHEEMTRYHVYLQVKKDLAEGRLAGAPFSTICLLTSYAAQVK